MTYLTHLIRKPSQVVLGRVYRVVGHSSSSGEALPPQVFCPHSVTRSPTGAGLFTGPAIVRIDLPDGSVYYDRRKKHVMPFFEINVDANGRYYEAFSDVHLEWYGSNAETLRCTMADTSQQERAGEKPRFRPTPRLWEKAHGG